MARVSASAALGQPEVVFCDLVAGTMNGNGGAVCFGPHGLTEWVSNALPETEDPDEDEDDEDEDDEEVDEDEDEDEEDEDEDEEDAL